MRTSGTLLLIVRRWGRYASFLCGGNSFASLFIFRVDVWLPQTLVHVTLVIPNRNESELEMRVIFDLPNAL